ncbi:Calpain-type cysteine protease DEK1 [Zea mays]|uniref:Calpain-type cysteine protease DEK1 n=1 Tax=Zea mays TaxID=4577 RepID=A0A1D6HFA1_MAIZE|nr:Calpain-type cysteine protease DEK1 [Zea mays]
MMAMKSAEFIITPEHNEEGVYTVRFYIQVFIV